MKIDGSFLTNLRFADDIFVCTETPQELQQMLQELSDESRRMGLKMNIAKTKMMRYNEESWQAGRHTPNTWISSTATLPSARRDRCIWNSCVLPASHLNFHYRPIKPGACSQ